MQAALPAAAAAAAVMPHLVCEWELDLAVVELLRVVTLAGGSGHGGSLDDLQHTNTKQQHTYMSGVMLIPMLLTLCSAAHKFAHILLFFCTQS